MAARPGEVGGFIPRGNFFPAPQDFNRGPIDLAPLQQGVAGLAGHPAGRGQSQNPDWAALVGTANGMLPRRELGPYTGVISTTEHWGAGGEFELTDLIATNWVTVDALARDAPYTTLICPPREHTSGPRIAIKTREFPLTLPSAVPNGGVPPIVGYRSGQRVVTMHRIGIALLMNVDELLMKNYREIFQKFRQIAASVLQEFNLCIIDAILSTPPHYYVSAAINGPTLTAADNRRQLERARDNCGALTKEPDWLLRTLEDTDAAFERGGLRKPTTLIHYHGMLTQMTRVTSVQFASWIGGPNRMPVTAADGAIIASMIGGKIAIPSPAIHTDSRGVVQDPLVNWGYIGDYGVSFPSLEQNEQGARHRNIKIWDFDGLNDLTEIKFADALENTGRWDAAGWLHVESHRRTIEDLSKGARADSRGTGDVFVTANEDGTRAMATVFGEIHPQYFTDDLLQLLFFRARDAILQEAVAGGAGLDVFASQRADAAAVAGVAASRCNLLDAACNALAFIPTHPICQIGNFVPVNTNALRSFAAGPAGPQAVQVQRRDIHQILDAEEQLPTYWQRATEPGAVDTRRTYCLRGQTRFNNVHFEMLFGHSDLSAMAQRRIQTFGEDRLMYNTLVSNADYLAYWLVLLIPIKLQNLRQLHHMAYCIPFTVFFFRPLGNTALGDMAVLIPGKETMALFIAHPHLMASTDAMSQDSFYNYSIHRAAVVLDETAVVVYRSVGFTGTGGGAGVDFFNVCSATGRDGSAYPRDAASMAVEYEAEVLAMTGSIFGVLAAGAEGTATRCMNPIDMTGSSTSMGYSAENSYGTFTSIAYGFPRVKTSARQDNAGVQPICWQGHQVLRETKTQNTGERGRVHHNTKAQMSGVGISNNLSSMSLFKSA